MSSPASDIANELARVSGFLRGIASWFDEEANGRLRDPWPAASEAERHAVEMSNWLHAVLVEAIERECDKLEALERDLYRLDRGEAPESPSPPTAGEPRPALRLAPEPERGGA